MAKAKHDYFTHFLLNSIPISLVTISACSSSLYFILSLTRSSQVTAANALKPEESVLNEVILAIGINQAQFQEHLSEPLKIHATTSPGSPGYCESVSITKYGIKWSCLWIRPKVIGSQSPYLANIAIPQRIAIKDKTTSPGRFQ